MRLENALYFDPDKPMRVAVRDEGGEWTVELFPKGDPITIPIYVAAD